MSARIFCVRVEKKNDDYDYMEIDLVEDVYYVSIFRPKKYSDGIFVLHTRYGDYHWINTLEGAKKLWRNYGFLALDSVNVVNMKQIVYVDPKELLVFFENGTFTTVSKPKMTLVKHLSTKKAGQ